MRKLLSVFLVAAIGGAVSLAAYRVFFNNDVSYKWVQPPTQPDWIATSGGGTPEAAPTDFVYAAEKTVNAVVHVKNVSQQERRSGSILDFFYGFEGTPRPQLGTGSGVIISPDGYIVTNNHVIDNSLQLEVTLNNNRTYTARIVGTDPNSDIALLKIDEEELPYLAFGNSDNTRVGEWVLAVGNPFNLTSTVTAGIISAKARSLSDTRDQSFIQTDAAVNPGNSGGALVNTTGELIGINTAITSQTGSYIGYSFAVPSNIAKKVVEDIMEYGEVQKGIIGISFIQPNTRAAAEQGLDEIEGVYVSSVEEGLGAEQAGVREGDIIKGIDRVNVRRFSELKGYLSSKRPGDRVLLKVERDGRTLELPVTLMKPQFLDIRGFGLRVKNLTDKDKRQYGIDYGAKITASALKFQDFELNGKVIVEVNGEKVRDIQDADRLLGGQSGSFSRRTSLILVNPSGDRERVIF